MNKLFKRCCEMGSYKHQVPMPINTRTRYIDYCIADIVSALNAANIKTSASCCGHNKLNGSILLEDGRCIGIYNNQVEMEVAVKSRADDKVIWKDKKYKCYYEKPCGHRLNGTCDLSNPKEDCKKYKGKDD